MVAVGPEKTAIRGFILAPGHQEIRYVREALAVRRGDPGDAFAPGVKLVLSVEEQPVGLLVGVVTELLEDALALLGIDGPPALLDQPFDLCIGLVALALVEGPADHRIGIGRGTPGRRSDPAERAVQPVLLELRPLRGD